MALKVFVATKFKDLEKYTMITLEENLISKPLVDVYETRISTSILTLRYVNKFRGKKIIRTQRYREEDSLRTYPSLTTLLLR